MNRSLVCALVCALCAFCIPSAGYAGDGDQGDRPSLDQRGGPQGAPPGSVKRPVTSLRISASYDGEAVHGTLLRCTASVSVIGNEPHTRVCIRPEGQKTVYDITPMEAAEDLRFMQNKRVSVEALVIDSDSAVNPASVIRVLSWKIVK